MSPLRGPEVPVVGRRKCMSCGAPEQLERHIDPVWGWHGKFMGRWCDSCRGERCEDCGQSAHGEGVSCAVDTDPIVVFAMEDQALLHIARARRSEIQAAEVRQLAPVSNGRIIRL